MTLITFSGRLHAARATADFAPGLLDVLRQAARRLADAPLDSSLLQARPVARTQLRTAARAEERAEPRARVARAISAPALRQYWLPLPGPDGKVRLEAHWSPRP
jgi:hypothetical protein